jgi:hypothetical protein
MFRSSGTLRGNGTMKIFSLEFISTRTGAAERIWHTNRRALERYSRALKGSSFQVRGIKAFDMPLPMNESRMVAFLNAHCADFMPPGVRQRAPASRKQRGGVG